MPKVVQQERISHQQVEQVVEVHVPMTQESGDASTEEMTPHLRQFSHESWTHDTCLVRPV